MSWTGGCNCGAIRYSFAADPVAVVACHCENCRRQSGGAYSVNAVFPTASLSLEGTPTDYQDTNTESGNPVLRQFCGTCGSPIFSRLAGDGAQVIVKVGTLDEPGTLAPQAQVWTDTAMPWVDLGAAMPSFPRNFGA